MSRQTYYSTSGPFVPILDLIYSSYSELFIFNRLIMKLADLQQEKKCFLLVRPNSSELLCSVRFPVIKNQKCNRKGRSVLISITKT